MGGKSSSKTTNVVENVAFNNVDYGGGGGSSGLAKNVNLSHSALSTGDISLFMTDHGAVGAGRDVALTALNTNQAGINRAYDFLEDQGELYADTANRMLSAGAALTGRAFDSMDETLYRAYSSMDDTLYQNADLTRRFIDGATDMAGRAYDDMEDSREWSSDIFTRGVDLVNDTQRTSMQHFSQTVDRALAFATQSTRSEAGQIAEGLTKTLAWAAVGLGAVFMFSRWK